MPERIDVRGEGRELARDEALVAGHQPGDRGVWRETRLGSRATRGQHRAAARNKRRPGRQKAPAWQFQGCRLALRPQTGRASAGATTQCPETVHNHASPASAPFMG